MTDPAGTPDPRGIALAAFLRQRAALFSLSADVHDSSHIAEAGMGLLAAATIAETLSGQDVVLEQLSERGLFETMPGGSARVTDSEEIGRSLSRSILGSDRDGRAVLHDLVNALAPWNPT